MIATLTSKGQVTLPKVIRNQLRLHAGDRLDFFVKGDGHIEVVPLKEPVTKLEKWWNRIVIIGLLVWETIQKIIETIKDVQ